MKKPKAPKPTAQEKAVEMRQQRALDEEIAEQEQRFRALARGKLGTASLVGGAPRSRQEAAMGRATAGGGAVAGRSLIGGRGAMRGAGGRGASVPGFMGGSIPNISGM